ncbi:hypothetical protein CDD82_7634 [Ophiocordyceps australis]|uniref:Uncharacterized protein n=1 Tax=Ophiocordyceps australis TaxID=1399860 RepID=A0A2C5YPG2_9HYPO|nr:hypothetical protein CDD82_7634 [Ophiocordyceps australis]
MGVTGSGHTVVGDEAKTITTTYCPSDAVTLTQTLTRASETRTTTITLNKDISTPTPPLDESRSSPANVTPDISAPAKIAIGISVSLGVVVCLSLWYWTRASRRRLRRPRKRPPSPLSPFGNYSPPRPGNDWPPVGPRPKPPRPPFPPNEPGMPKPKKDGPEGSDPKPKPSKPWNPPDPGLDDAGGKPDPKPRPNIKVNVKLHGEHIGVEEPWSLPFNPKPRPESPLNGEPRQPGPKPKPSTPFGGAAVQPPYVVKPPTWHTPGKSTGGKHVVTPQEPLKKPGGEKPSIQPFDYNGGEAPGYVTTEAPPPAPGPQPHIQSPPGTRHPSMPISPEADYGVDYIQPPSEDLDDLQSIRMEPFSMRITHSGQTGRHQRPGATRVKVTKSGKLQYIRGRERERQDVSSGRRHTMEGRERESSSYARPSRQDYDGRGHQGYSREGYPPGPEMLYMPA